MKESPYPGQAPALAEVLSVLERTYPPSWAQDWDAVGLVCGDPDSPVGRVLLAVDPVADVVAEALAWKADLVVAHHPLMLRPVHGVPASTPKGRIVHDLIRAGCGLYVAHTNADAARPGVSDALARTLGVDDLRPLSAHPEDPLDKVVTFVPQEHADRVVDALAEAGAGSIGEYERCAWTTTGTGTFLPGQDAEPTVGTPGTVETVTETRVEMVLPRARRGQVVAALRQAHPYEEPAFDVLELASWSSPRGIGRVGSLAAPVTLADFVDVVARTLPYTVQGVRVAGEPEAMIQRVAVCGGSGDSLFDAVRASGADVYVTADLRHHPASEARETASGATPYLVDVAHWASEWPWLHGAAERLSGELSAAGFSVETRVSQRRTDPWTFRVPSSGGVVK